MSSHLLEYLKTRWFTEHADKDALVSALVPFNGIGHMIASVSFCPTGGKMILGPKKNEIRVIGCETSDDYSDWDTFCLVKVEDPPFDPRLLIVRQEQLETPPIN